MTPIASEPCPLSKNLVKRLLAYAAVAGAGAAAASPAQAEIVYTPVRTNLDYVYPFDLDHDGIPDFQVGSIYLSGFETLAVYPLITGNKIAGTKRNRCFGFGTDAAALPAGAKIGPGRSFQSRANCMAAGYSGLYGGPWFEARDRYLGFAFLINGETHYGWARLSVRSAFAYPGMARILGYAYETIPNNPIIAGDEGKNADVSQESGTLGALALGATKF
jgi:hypothetical protein